MIPAILNFTLLLIISLIHVYWAAGGRWGLAESVPKLNGAKAIKPGRFTTLVVALIFGFMAFFYLYKIGWLTPLNIIVPDWLTRSGPWFLAGIFLLRAIGDFRYVGLFKRVRGSRFSQLDTNFYSPLCLLLSVNSFLLTY
ncbi:DUF3995 domain-containing protein [Spirosoma luteum]|uniref:DUF3995 domain-containing protein n=1 Tax=Spirosoma luteum TaxID=431553 RepID=UPI00035D8CF4|nr:DUF3995 domain-containing protein [Spirosoma luteum]